MRFPHPGVGGVGRWGTALGASFAPLQTLGRMLCAPTNSWAQALRPYKLLGASFAPLQTPNSPSRGKPAGLRDVPTDDC